MKALYNATEVINRLQGHRVYVIDFDGVASSDDPGCLELSPEDAAKLAWDLLQWLPEETVKRIREDL